MPGPFSSVHTLSWNANSESDLSHYLVYFGRAAGDYSDPRSPINVGLTTVCSIVFNDSGGLVFRRDGCGYGEQ
jgi:hypothetical protein